MWRRNTRWPEPTKAVSQFYVDHAFEGVAYERRLVLLEMKILPQMAFA